jgi:elongation factor P--beta-lysine ligase
MRGMPFEPDTSAEFVMKQLLAQLTARRFHVSRCEVIL